MYMQNHVAGVIFENAIGVRGGIIEELRQGLCGGVGGLGRGQGAEGYQHGTVNGAGIVKEGAQYLLETEFAGRIKRWRGIGGHGELRGGSIGGGSPWVWCMDWFGWGRVLETVECFGDVSWHGELDGSGGVIPVESEPAIFGAGPVGGDSVEFL